MNHWPSTFESASSLDRESAETVAAATIEFAAGAIPLELP